MSATVPPTKLDEKPVTVRPKIILMLESHEAVQKRQAREVSDYHSRYPFVEERQATGQETRNQRDVQSTDDKLDEKNVSPHCSANQ